jgi:anti-sigma regulatory factor (Ser/Thr protein kinase)
MLDLHDAVILSAVRQTPQLASEAALRTGLSRVAASRRLQRLVQAGYLVRQGQGTRPTYRLGPRRFWRGRSAVTDLRDQGGEFAVWERHLAPLLQDLPAHAVNLASIAFTEMLNNALDHAQASQVAMGLHVADGRLQMFVSDDGAGIFRRIAEALKLFDTRLAVLELAKGKFTTAPEGHSGMGVFVSSRMLDGFAIESGDIVFDRRIAKAALAPFDWVDISRSLETPAATTVRMDLDLATPRTAAEVYARYFDPDESGGDAFHTTEVPVRLAQLSSQLVSRSQAKWVVERATDFRTVVLDFEGVGLIGQAFADEIFRVFATAHPEVRLRRVNATGEVEGLLLRFGAGRA